ncbi:MAG: flagellar motor protein MotB [Defluviitaleaceae bacterium]|nr:flagellar motor protein MotB [Defluviitaleaceae bacterium]
MRRKKEVPNANKVLPGWMASYADMFTVLMAFFVILFAMSTIEQELFERVLASFNPSRVQEDFNPAQIGGGDTLIDRGQGILPEVVPSDPAGAEGDEGGIGLGGYDADGDAVGEMVNTFMTYMAAMLGIDDDTYGMLPNVMTEGENYIRINIEELAAGGVFFSSGQARLTSAAVSVLDYIGPMLLTFSQDGHGIVVEGHTDNLPINTPAFPSNWTLSGARASSVVEHLVRTQGIDVHMIAGLGRGEYFPIADNNTVDGRAQNRRVEVKIFTPEVTAGGAIGGWFTIPGTR